MFYKNLIDQHVPLVFDLRHIPYLRYYEKINSFLFNNLLFVSEGKLEGISK